MLDNAPNQPSKFRTKYWVEINDQSRGTYNTNAQVRSKTTKTSLCDYSDAYILVKGQLIPKQASAGAAANNTNKKVIFKNCSPFTDCMIALHK